jgi:hypothetical protein
MDGVPSTNTTVSGWASGRYGIETTRSRLVPGQQHRRGDVMGKIDAQAHAHRQTQKTVPGILSGEKFSCAETVPGEVGVERENPRVAEGVHVCVAAGCMGLHMDRPGDAAGGEPRCKTGPHF